MFFLTKFRDGWYSSFLLLFILPILINSFLGNNLFANVVLFFLAVLFIVGYFNPSKVIDRVCLSISLLLFLVIFCVINMSFIEAKFENHIIIPKKFSKYREFKKEHRYRSAESELMLIKKTLDSQEDIDTKAKRSRSCEYYLEFARLCLSTEEGKYEEAKRNYEEALDIAKVDLKKDFEQYYKVIVEYAYIRYLVNDIDDLSNDIEIDIGEVVNYTSPVSFETIKMKMLLGEVYSLTGKLNLAQEVANELRGIYQNEKVDADLKSSIKRRIFTIETRYISSEDDLQKYLFNNQLILSEEGIPIAIYKPRDEIVNFEEAHILNGTIEEIKKAIRFNNEHLSLLKKSNDASNDNERLLIFKEALVAIDMSYKIKEDILGLHHPETTIALNNKGVVYQKMGYIDLAYAEEAKKIFEESLKDREKLGQDHPYYAQALHNLAFVNAMLKNYEESERQYLKCLSIRERVYGKESSKYEHALRNFKLMMKESGQEDRLQSLGF